MTDSKSSRFAMVMAGGVGARLWPMSRRSRPKQLLPIHHGRSLLELAVGRLDGVVAGDHRLVCTGETHRAAIRGCLPALSEDQILGEPMGRNTLNAVGLTAAILAEQDPDAVFAVLTADHIIEPVEEFQRKLEIGFALAESSRHRFVTFAIKPTFAATGYGWVKQGAPVDGVNGAFHAENFHEKPELAIAEKYLADATYGWNSGMFIFPAAGFMDALAWYEPGCHEGLTQIAKAWSSSKRAETLAQIYPTLKSISVDHGVMNLAAKDDRIDICAVPMNVSWIDIGSWPSYGETIDPDAAGNQSNGKTLLLDCKNVLAVSDDPEHVIAAVGCEDLIIVRTTDATLICPRDQAQRVKEIVDAVDERLR